VARHSEGTRHIYRVNPDGLAALRAWLGNVWDQALTAFHKTVQADSTNPDEPVPDDPGQEP
jgi:DNA-binding PadR family transcriptional regulator